MAKKCFACLILLFIGLASGCRQSHTSQLKNAPNHICVYITPSGQIKLDNKAVTLQEAGTIFASLAQKNGIVLYSLKDYESTSTARDVRDLITQNNLPIKMCKYQDCSDAF